MTDAGHMQGGQPIIPAPPSRTFVIDTPLVERLCEVMHDAYEAAAVEAGWDTQARSRKPWSDVPEANKVTMRAAVRAVLAEIDRLGAV